MKMFRKGMVALGIGFLIVGSGCSCNNNDDNTPPVTENYQEDKNYEDYSNSLQGLYEETVQSTVAIIAYAPNDPLPSVGTGVVYKEETAAQGANGYAYILTNAHVLFTKYEGNTIINKEYTQKVEVIHSNYVRVEATVMGYDRNEDVAVLRIAKSNNYKIADIVENDNSTLVGESVYTIGNPNSNYFSMTDGVISTTKIKTSLKYIAETDTQTTYVYNSTATINGGNSGGPLFNSQGEVVSINTMHPADLEKYKNYNYSIPVNHFINVANNIIISGQNNSYKRVTLNLSGNAISSYTVSSKISSGIRVDNGIYITNSGYANISPNSRVLLEVGGVAVNTMEDVEYELLTNYSNKTSVELTVIDKAGINKDYITVTLVK